MNAPLALSLIAATLYSTGLAQPSSPASGLPPTWGDAARPAIAPSSGASAARDISATLEPIRTKNNVPALVALVIDSSGTLQSGVSGVRRAGSSTPVTINDQFHLGSCGKAMTATLCAVLVQEGALNWETTLGQVFTPTDPGSKFKVPESWRDQELQHLLTNSGGGPDNLDANGLWGKLYAFEGSPTDARRLMLEGVFKTSPYGKPGQRYQYSNAGFALAGHMAETVAGRSFEELMQAKVFGPLGITTAGFGAPGAPGSLDQPRGHSKDGQPVEPSREADNPPAIAPAGTMSMSLPDWAKFVRAHLRGARGEADSAGLLNAAAYEKLHTVGVKGTDYAMGWIVIKRPQWAKGAGENSEGRTLTHTGSNTLWTATVWIAPEIDRAFLVASNTGASGGSGAREDALLAMINLDREARGLKPIKP